MDIMTVGNTTDGDNNEWQCNRKRQQRVKIGQTGTTAGNNTIDGDDNGRQYDG